MALPGQKNRQAIGFCEKEEKVPWHGEGFLKYGGKRVRL